MKGSDLLNIVAIIVTVLSLLSGCFGADEKPACTGDIVVNGGEVHITCVIE